MDDRSRPRSRRRADSPDLGIGSAAETEAKTTKSQAGGTDAGTSWGGGEGS